MQLFVKSLDRTFVVNVDEAADVSAIKAAIEDVEFIPAEYMRLVTGTRSLTTGIATGLTDSDTVTMLVSPYSVNSS
jgi:hypothetical protein